MRSARIERTADGPPDLDRLHGAVWRNQDLRSYAALHIHRTSKVGILRGHSADDFACAFSMILTLKAGGNDHERRRQSKRQNCKPVLPSKLHGLRAD